MLAYQTMFYYGLKRVGGPRYGRVINGLSANISHPVVLYYDNNML